MDTKPIKAFLSSRGMLVMIAALGLVLGWYLLFKTQGTQDHLVKRNFNFLNQIAVNMNASVESANEAVRFNNRDINSCLKKNMPDYIEQTRLGDSRTPAEGLQSAIDTASTNSARASLSAATWSPAAGTWAYTRLSTADRASSTARVSAR